MENLGIHQLFSQGTDVQPGSAQGAGTGAAVAQGTFHCSSVGQSHPSSTALGSRYLKDIFTTSGVYEKDPASAGYLEILRGQMPRAELVLWTSCTALDLLPRCNSSHVSHHFLAPQHQAGEDQTILAQASPWLPS